MKAAIWSLVLVSLLVLLAVTNPDLPRFEAYCKQTFRQEVGKGDDPLAGALGSLLGGLAGSWMASRTVRHDYVIFSLYETELGPERLRVVGVLNQFIVVDRPRFPAGGDRQPATGRD